MQNILSKLSNLLNEAGNWLLLSSANPQEGSFMFKGLLLGVVPTIIWLSGLAHVTVGQDLLNEIVNDAALFVQYVLAAIAAGMTLYGALRKFFFLFSQQQTPPNV